MCALPQIGQGQPSGVTTIRSAALTDMSGVYRVCLQTGDSGLDATDQYANPDLLGHIYVGPYVVGFPDLAYVVADRAGVAGYTFAVENTLAFEEWERDHWWAALRAQYPLSPVQKGVQQGALKGALKASDEALIEQLHHPEHTPDSIALEYPGHLHIDLLPRVHGQGLGRTLVELILTRLRERKVRGVHLGVSPDNHNAVSFYRHLGFTVLIDDEHSLYMGMRLS